MRRVRYSPPGVRLQFILALCLILICILFQFATWAFHSSMAPSRAVYVLLFWTKSEREFHLGLGILYQRWEGQN
ncbi:hypothetical protein QJS04_geneDACA010778 [Acorus gramineus]|uniref:Uncharacterized protein n=1 Tax=Acorus gramineus TaxID=55184 RepID=A0AAV9B9D8_ACOGR|nr:hypothetical protein QJS04_geneDACA010778 [Acorus gramineus]